MNRLSPNALNRSVQRIGTALVVALTLVIAGCDNPACVLGGDCSSTSNNNSLGGANPAFRPANHVWMLQGPPTVTRVEPAGTNVHTGTPIAVVFNESMAQQTVVSNVGLFEVGGFNQPVPILPATLVGDGRMLIVIPLDTPPVGGLQADTTYELRWDEDAVVTDLTGTELALPADGVITSFTTAATNPATPGVLLSFPADTASQQSATGEIAVVFDRPMVQGTVTSQSFVVTADGAPPAFDPPVQPVLLIGQGAFPTTDTRVWQYRSVDGAGEAVSLGASAAVRVQLSPSGSQITSEDGGTLPETFIDFNTAAFAAPTAAALLSMPDDAIGIENLITGGSSPLNLAVTLPNAQNSDLIGIFMVGIADNQTQSQNQAVFREVRIGDIAYDAMTGVATLTEAELDLSSSGSPVDAIFADGALTIALRTERGGTLSPVMLVDVDGVTAGTQDALLDVTRPTFTAFGSTGNESAVFYSDQRDLAVVGRASEELRAVFVDTGAQGDNGAPFGGTTTPAVVGSSSDGLFVAAPVQVGALDPTLQPLPFTMEIYDRALNRASTVANGTFVQYGSGFGAAGGAGSSLDLEVFDARTLDPIQGASVYMHADTGGGVSFISVSVTDANGLPVPPLVFPAGEAVVTVEASNYDLLTYHGVPSSWLSVPLKRTSNQPGTVSGTVFSTNTEFPNYDRYLKDSAVFPTDGVGAIVSSCSFNVGTLSNECSYGPLSVQPGPVRAASLVAAEVPNSIFNFTASSFLRSFSLEVPLAAASPGATSDYDVRVDQLLSDTDTPQEQRAVDGPVAALDASSLTGVDLNDLNGEPRVSVEALVPGVGGASLVGFGAALDAIGSPPDTWSTASAVAGLADPTNGKYVGDELGELVLERTIDDDLFLRVELVDSAGNRAGRRPRFSVLGATVSPLEVPLLSAPAAGGNTVTEGFDVTFDNTLSAVSGTGLYRVTLDGPSSRSWTLYRRASGGGSRTVHFPDLVAAGGSGLPNGTLDCSVEAYAWPGFSASAFLFSDIAREHDRFAEGAPISFDKP